MECLNTSGESSRRSAFSHASQQSIDFQTCKKKLIETTSVLHSFKSKAQKTIENLRNDVYALKNQLENEKKYNKEHLSTLQKLQDEGNSEIQNLKNKLKISNEAKKDLDLKYAELQQKSEHQDFNCKSSEQQIQYLRSVLNDTRSRISDQNEEINDLKLKLETPRKEMPQINDSSEKFKSHISQLKHELEVLHGSNSDLSKTVNKRNTEISKYLQDIEEKDKKIVKLTSAANGLRAKYSELEKKLRPLKERLESNEKSQQSMRSSLHSRNLDYETLAGELAIETEKNKTLHAANQNLASQLDEIKTQLSPTESLLETILPSSPTSIIDKIKLLIEKSKNLENQLVSMKSQKETITAEHNAAVSQLTASNNLNMLQVKNSNELALKQAADSHEHAIAELRHKKDVEISSLSNKISTLLSEKSNLEHKLDTEMAKIESDKKSLNFKLEKSKRTAEDLRNLIENQNKTIKNHEDCVTEQKETIQTLRCQLENTEKSVAELKTEKTTLKNNFQLLENGQQAFTNESMKLKNELSTLRNSLAISQNSVEKMNHQNTKLSLELSEMQSKSALKSEKLQSLFLENKELQENKHKFLSEIQHLTERVSSFEEYKSLYEQIKLNLSEKENSLMAKLETANKEKMTIQTMFRALEMKNSKKEFELQQQNIELAKKISLEIEKKKEFEYKYLDVKEVSEKANMKVDILKKENNDFRVKVDGLEKILKEVETSKENLMDKLKSKDSQLYKERNKNVRVRNEATSIRSLEAKISELQSDLASQKSQNESLLEGDFQIIRFYSYLIYIKIGAFSVTSFVRE